MPQSPVDTHRTAAVELRHLSATKLLEPSDILRISADLERDGDVGEENIPNYDNDWETDLGGRRKTRQLREKVNGSKRDTALGEDEDNEDEDHDSNQRSSITQNEPVQRSSREQSTKTAAAPAAEAAPKAPSPTPQMERAPYMSSGPVVYKQLQLDDDHDDHDIIIHDQSDLDLHTPTMSQQRHWGRNEGGWLNRRLRGIMEMFCMAVPCSPQHQ